MTTFSRISIYTQWEFFKTRSKRESKHAKESLDIDKTHLNWGVRYNNGGLCQPIGSQMPALTELAPPYVICIQDYDWHGPVLVQRRLLGTRREAALDEGLALYTPQVWHWHWQQPKKKEMAFRLKDMVCSIYRSSIYAMESCHMKCYFFRHQFGKAKRFSSCLYNI